MVRPTLSARSSQGQCPYSLAKSLERQLMKLSSFLVVFGQIVKVPPSRGRKASNAGTQGLPFRTAAIAVSGIPDTDKDHHAH